MKVRYRPLVLLAGEHVAELTVEVRRRLVEARELLQDCRIVGGPLGYSVGRFKLRSVDLIGDDFALKFLSLPFPL